MTNVVCSFWVKRKEFPKAPPYLEMLKILDRSCKRFGFRHVVMTDSTTVPEIYGTGLETFFVDLPENLMKATTQVQWRWLASPHSEGLDTSFMGADCLVLKDFRKDLPPADLAVAYMKGHKRWRMNNGFFQVPAESRDKVASVFKFIADDTGDEMFEDMLAIERALQPMPEDYTTEKRRGLDVAFLPIPVWNRYMQDADDSAEEANVLHFMGGHAEGKSLFFEWARRHGYS